MPERAYEKNVRHLVRRAGAHTQDGRGFVVDKDGCVVRKNGLFTSGGWRYLSDTDTGCIFADGALHRADGHVVLTLRGGQLLQGGAMGEYLFDENGYTPPEMKNWMGSSTR